MSLFSKLTTELPAKLPNRFLEKGGFMPMGAVDRTARTNTAKELVDSIKAYAKESPEVAEFAKHLDEMQPQHLGLAQDIIDLSNTQEMLMTNINLKAKMSNGKTPLGCILEMLPATSKNNPAALDLAEEVINHSDTTNSKYFLCNLFGYDLPKMGGLAEQMKATKEVVGTVAKDTLSGGYLGTFEKNKEFFEFIRDLSSGDSKPENIKLLKPLRGILEKFIKNSNPHCNIYEIRTGDTKTIQENLKILPQVLGEADKQGKSIDVSGFLTKNVNLE